MSDIETGLREYQVAWIRAIWSAWKLFRCVLAVLPSGSGKTHAYVRIVQQEARAGKRVLIVVTTQQILEQTHKRLVADGLNEGTIGVIWRHDRRTKPSAPVQLASVDTLTRRAVPAADVVILDECHHAMAPKFLKILGWFREAKILGVTATPMRLDGKPLGEVFETLVQVEDGTPSKLTDAGWIAKASVWSWSEHLDLAGLRKVRGDYERGRLGERMSRSIIVGDAVEHYRRLASGLPAIAFCATVKQAKAVAAAFGAAGVRPELLTAKTSPSARKAMFRRLAKGRTKVLVTCDTVSEGWDLPIVKCAILLRPTLSLVRFLQQVARALRPHEGITPIILDHAGCVRQFGLLPHHDIEWSLERAARRLGAGGPGIAVDGDGAVREVEREPESVGGDLSKVERVERQTVCAGWDGPCPNGRKPYWYGFSPSAFRRRGGPWRCIACASRKRTANPAWRSNVVVGASKRAADPGWRAKNAENLRKARAALAAKLAAKGEQS